MAGTLINGGNIQRTYDFGGGAKLEFGKRTLIMGILNATPDSFSDGGNYNTVETAVAHAVQMAKDGADLIDIGGESTRPGSEKVSLEEELQRVIPVIQAIREALPTMPLSIDTYKAETARQALEAGAHIINDVWALKADPDMAAVAAQFNCPVILCHNRHDENYGDLIADMITDLQESVEIARAAGISTRYMWIDPGPGFAKSTDDNLLLMGRLADITSLGFPVLLAPSRKRFIRATLDLPVDDLVEGTAATVALGIAQGCHMVRVHDVKAIKRTAMMADAIVYRGSGSGRNG